MTPKTLDGKVALVAGATRGAGRGIAVELGAAGATVYCTGRSTREARSEYDRPETIEETAELVDAAGGRGIAVRVDHLVPEEVRALVARVDAEHGRLDVLVNDVWGGERLFEWQSPLWEHDLGNGLRLLRLAVETHLITSHHALPLLIRRPGGLVVEMTDGTAEYNATRYRNTAFYDLAKSAVIRLAFGQSRELAAYGATAVALTPGWMRSEMMLDAFGVTEPPGATRSPPSRTSPSLRPRASSAGRSPRWRPIRTSRAATGPRCRAVRSPPSTASRTSTGAAPTAGATSSRSRKRGGPPTPRATAERAAAALVGEVEVRAP
jgi:NAD(P)-dependent dehydrogenase (short-subunit alcohol dehydrogenase family)